MRLKQRVDALEGSRGYSGPAAWIVVRDDETQAAAIAKYEAEHGPIGDRMAIIWQPVTGGPMPCA